MVGLLFVFGAVMIFIVMPAVVIIGRWKTLEPAARSGLVAIWVILVALAALLYGLIDHWAGSGPLS
jgi:hypothetical protein